MTKTPKKAASWFEISILETCVPAPPISSPSWGSARVRLDYARGGYTVAIVPLWMVGHLCMARQIQGRTGKGSTAGVMWWREWQAGQEHGLVKVVEFVSAADARAADIGAVDLDQWRQSAAIVAARQA